MKCGVSHLTPLFAVLVIGSAATTGCGYRLVKMSELTAKRSAADSAARESLERQYLRLDAQCRADSLRLVAMLKDRPPTVVTVPAQPTPQDSILKARDAEIASLRDQLARANAELERIKKRLANPKV